MCTRYFIEPETREIKEIIAKAKESLLYQRFIEIGKAVLTSGEIRPTNVVPVIAPNRDGRRTVFPMRWGFQFPDRSPLVNARTETAAEKPTFKEAWAKHRCIIPSSWYYEWEHLTSNTGKKKAGIKYMIQPKNSNMTWLCGLYRMEDGLPAFAVLTRDPAGELCKIHDRMPLIFPQDKIGAWIDPNTKPEELLQYALTDMVFEKAV